MNRKRGAKSSTKSETRSATLKGRPSRRKGQRSIPRSAQVVGLVRQPKPDPRLIPWPADCVQIVAATPATVNVRGIRGRITDQVCADCQARLAVDSFTISTAWAMPERMRRPLRFICVDCFSRYDRNMITHLVDHRRTSGANEGTQLDE